MAGGLQDSVENRKEQGGELVPVLGEEEEEVEEDVMFVDEGERNAVEVYLSELHPR